MLKNLWDAGPGENVWTSEDLMKIKLVPVFYICVYTCIILVDPSTRDWRY